MQEITNKQAQEWLAGFVSEEEAAKMIGWSKKTICMYRRGEIAGKTAPRAYRFGRHWRYKVTDVIAFMESRSKSRSAEVE